MIKRTANRYTLIHRIDVIPYIDVMLVLLVIFMMTSPFLSIGQVRLPSLTHAERVQSSPIVIRLTPGHVFVRVASREVEVQSSELLNVLKQSARQSSPRFFISADGTLPYHHVMALLDRLQQGGIAPVSLMVYTER